MASWASDKDSLAFCSSSSCFQEWEYDVFLSFRGEDTRNGFVSHLYRELDAKGIITFKDDQEIGRGQSISQELLKAIESSRILIVIFSRNYVSSTWCLDELVKIYECKKAEKQTILPIFYDVSPSQLRKQIGRFKSEHVNLKKYIDKVKMWKLAIEEVVNLCGQDLQNGDESQFIQGIVRDILLVKMRTINSSIDKNYVGMDSRLKKIASCLNIEQQNNVRIIGICGMGGIGKTTIASVVYRNIYGQFDGSIFLLNVREESKKSGLLSLQKQILSATLKQKETNVWDVYRGIDEISNRLRRKKVLIVLDDVDHVEQLEFLTGNHDWFGPGSRIIVTTRDEHLLNQHGVDELYRVEGLNHDEALKLFSLKAFKKDFPAEDYINLSIQVVRYAGGLPLALNVLGSSLYGKSVKEWNSTLDKLNDVPNEKILNKLQVSFDGLEESVKNIFLDIACFFKGKKHEYVVKVLESCGFHPEIGIRELIDKSLITISNNKVWMHDLLQEMGRQIVRRESLKDPGRRSRIWTSEDFHHILMNDAGTEQIEGIVLDCEFEKEEIVHLSAKGFSKMKYLRLLILQNVHIFHDIEYLSTNLRYLEWFGYSSKSLPSTFKPDRIVELRMRCSSIEQLWKEMNPIKTLKIIDVAYCENLIKTPDFRVAPNLEELNLEGCTRIIEVHQSIGNLKRLALLNLKGCENLRFLPSSLCNLNSLRILNLHGCTRLSMFPDVLGNMACLEELDVGGIGTGQMSEVITLDFLPSWLVPWKKQNPMDFVLPSLSGLRVLRRLDLSYCNVVDGAIPNDLGSLALLEDLNLSGNDFVSIPSSIAQLSQLTYLSFASCRRLHSLPDLPPNIRTLNMEDCILLEELPNLFRLSGLEYLEFANCKRLQRLPDLPLSVKSLDVENCISLETLPNILQLSELEYLAFVRCKRLGITQRDLSGSIKRFKCKKLEFIFKSCRSVYKQHKSKFLYWFSKLHPQMG